MFNEKILYWNVVKKRDVFCLNKIILCGSCCHHKCIFKLNLNAHTSVNFLLADLKKSKVVQKAYLEHRKKYRYLFKIGVTIRHLQSKLRIEIALEV